MRRRRSGWATGSASFPTTSASPSISTRRSTACAATRWKRCGRWMRGESCSRVEAMVSAPGRVNLIGEHIDYHGLAVLPMALRRSIRIHFRARADGRICVTSGAYGYREFAWTPGLTPVARGDWENYLRAAAQAIAGKWGVMNGMDATIDSDLPAAVGLSSSSALIVAV